MILGVLDIETTGIDKRFHRIIEVGVRLITNRVIKDDHYQQYIQPGRSVDPGAFAVHGISDGFLRDKPTFQEISSDLKAFLQQCDAIVIHNAKFDHPFLKMEFAIADIDVGWFDEIEVIDTLLLARESYPGQRNNLDALCDRLGVKNNDRQLHGALKDADLLAQVYLEMTRKQAVMGLGGDAPKNDLLVGVKDVPHISYEVLAQDLDLHREWLASNSENLFLEEA